MKNGDYYLDAQMSLLGSLMLDPKGTAAEIFDEVTEDDFRQGEYKNIFHAARRLFLEGVPIDAVVLADRLGDEYINLLAQMLEVTPTAANYQTYIDIVKKESRRMKTQETAAKLNEMVLTRAPESEIREAAARILESITDRKRDKPVSLMQGYVDFLNRLDRKTEYLDWGFEKLNRKLYAERGDFIIIGARPSAGKTMLALNFAYRMSARYKVGFFSLETSDVKIFDRMFSSVFRADLAQIKTGSLPDAEKERIAYGKSKMFHRQFEYVQASGMTVEDIRQTTLRYQYDVIFIDYIGLVRGQGKDLREKTTSVSIGLHEMARSMGITVVALSQFSRPPKDRRITEPAMEDLRESGQLEQDADIIMLLHKREKDNPRSDRRLIIAKNKEGITGYIDLFFDGETQTFSEVWTGFYPEKKKESCQSKAKPQMEIEV